MRHCWMALAGGLVALALMAGCGRKPTQATKAQKITIAWAQWAPADYLSELGKEYTKQTGTEVMVEQIPWPQYQDKIFAAFAAGDSTYDIVVGDSQWLGRCSALAGNHYIELTDWMKKNLDASSIVPQALMNLGEYPKGSGRYWAVPAETDAVGFAYRRDLFENPKERAAFKAKYGRDLAPPKTWQELRDIAAFFTRPPELYGVALYFGKQYDTVTMGFQEVMWSFGGAYDDPKTYRVQGVLNDDAGVKALQFYVGLKPFTPPGSESFGIGKECVDAFNKGLVAMAEDFFAFFPGLADPTKNPHAKVTGFFPSPAAIGPDGKERHYISIGGQGFSVPRYSKNQETALDFIKWFCQEPVQLKWASLGGFTANKKVLASEKFLSATPYNRAFAAAFPYLRDFYAVPQYGELLTVTQTEWNAAVNGQKSAQVAMDEVAKQHTAILKKAGFIK